MGPIYCPEILVNKYKPSWSTSQKRSFLFLCILNSCGPHFNIRFYTLFQFTHQISNFWFSSAFFFNTLSTHFPSLHCTPNILPISYVSRCSTTKSNPLSASTLMRCLAKERLCVIMSDTKALNCRHL